jgi:hypothetical protein
MVEALLPVLRTLGLVISRNSTYFTHVDKLFHEDGSMVEERVEQYTKSITGVYRDLVWLAEALRTARQTDK